MDFINIVSRFTDCLIEDGNDGILKCLTELSASADEAESAVLDKVASDFFKIQDAFKKKIEKTELRFMGNIIEDLVFSRNLDHTSIINRSGALGYDIAQPHRVLIAIADDKNDAPSRIKIAAELEKAAQNRLSSNGGGMVLCRDDELLIIHRQSTKRDDIEKATQLADDLIEVADKEFRVKLFIGIGNVCSGLDDYKGSYQAAKKALEIGEFMITEGRVRSFEQFKVHALFLSTLKPEELRKYANSQLGELLGYDKTHKTEFTKTLQEYLYLRNSIEGTAKSINMSVSGLKYRLKKIEQILNCDLRDNKVCFDLQLAFVVSQLFGEYRIL